MKAIAAATLGAAARWPSRRLHSGSGARWVALMGLFDLLPADSSEIAQTSSWLARFPAYAACDSRSDAMR